MKILQFIPNLRMGGAEIMCENLSNALKEKGHNVVVVSLFNEETLISKRLEQNGIKVVFLNKKLGFDLEIFSQISKLIKQERPDVVHAHLRSMPYVMPVATWHHVKRKVYTFHSIAQTDGGKVGKLIYRFFFKHLAVIPVSLSKLVQKSICDVHQLPIENIPVVFNGVNLSRCIPKDSYSYDDEFKVIHVGRFADVKNHYAMVTALAELKQEKVRFQFMGDGPLEDDIRQLAKDLDVEDKIDFLGLQSNVYPFLHNADAFVLPSKYEGIPMSIAEAMGTGLPIIASNVGGIPDMLTNEESAILIQPTKDDIIIPVKRLMNDETLRRCIGTKAREKSVYFSAEMMAEKYIQVYSK